MTAGPPDPGRRRDALVAVGLALVAFAVYAASAPRTVTLEDDGLFVLATWFGGTAHPPGYPLHTLLTWPVALLPIGSVALRVHLTSAVFGALACGALFAVARLLGVSRVSAVAAGAAFAVSDAFWSQAIIAEVYSLNALLYLAAFGLCLAARAPGRERLLFGAAFVAGLGCSNHWPIFVGCAPALAVVAWPRWRVALGAAPRLLGCLALGLLPYAWLVVRSQMDPAIGFYGPIDSWERFWFVVGQRGYGEARVNPLLGIEGRLAQLGFWASQAVQQFTPVGAALAAAGAVLAWRRWPRDVAAGVLLAAVATPALLLIAVNQPMDDHLNRAVMRVYPLVTYGMMALWIGVALDAAGRARPAGMALPIVVALVHAPANVRRADTWAADYARAMLGTAAEGAVVFVHSDVDTGPLGYVHLVEDVRPDVTLHNSQGLVLARRAAPPWADATTLTRETAALLDRTTTPVYAFPEPPPWFAQLLAERGGIQDFGFVWRADRTLPRGARAPRADPALMAYLDRVLDAGDLTDAWAVHHRNRLIGQAGWMFGALLADDPGGATRAAHAERIARIERHYLGRVRMVDAVSGRGDPAALLQRLDGAEALDDGTFRADDRALLPVLRGRLHERRGDLEAAIAAYEHAAGVLPERRNPAIAHLERLYAQLGRRVELGMLRRRFAP